MKIKLIKNRLILDSKTFYQVWHILVIIKVLKSIRNIVELAVKVEKSNCNRLHSRCKPSKTDSELKVPFH